MANVSFKRGLASALTATGFTAQDGVFYLTTDSHRLYVGQNSELVELNRYVKVVATTDNLPSTPAKDDFAFVTTGNMLLVCKDPSAEGIKKWTQINS
nr:MAG TPA: major tropism determinant [Caudoviricetes sp.]